MRVTFFFLTVVCLGAGCNSTEPSASPQGSSEERYRDALIHRLQALGNQEIGAKVSLARWVSIEDLNELLSATGSPRITAAKLLLPRVADGYRVPISTSSSDPKAIMAALYAEADQLTRLNPEDASLIHVTQPQDVQVGTIQVIAFPTDLLSWWQQHPEEVRFVLPSTNVLDQAQMTFEPGEPVP